MTRRRGITGDRSRRREATDTRRLERLLVRERELWASGLSRVAGVDEAGVGPLAGPVVAAAVIFSPGQGLAGVDDSKRLSASRREELASSIRRFALDCSVAVVEAPEIDELNIYHAGLEAMLRAVEGLVVRPEMLLVDGRTIPGTDLPQERWIGGDARCHSIAAASILAKTARDALMIGYDRIYPGYGFASHKGYPTRAHRDAIRRLGPTPIHRRSFTLLPPQRLWD
jgi:ribonuclease HII